MNFLLLFSQNTPLYIHLAPFQHSHHILLYNVIPTHVSCEVLDIEPQHLVIGASNNFSLQDPVQALFLPKHVTVRLSSSAVYLSPVDDVHINILEHLVVCERVVGGRAAMQCDRLVMVLSGSLYFHRLQTTLLCIDFAHTP